MKIYVIRHGRTDTNEKGLLNGLYDEDINDIGIKQALEARNILKHKDIDLIVSSSLLRAIHTAEIVNVNDVPIIINDKFIERDMGELTLKKSCSVDYNEYCKFYESKYKGLENVSDLIERVYSGIEELINNYNNKNILIVTHGAVTRCINAYFNGIPNDLAITNARTQKNCEIVKYEVNKFNINNN